ncbi:MAG: ATP-binding protein [Gemmataceae bacterium]
MLEHSIAVGGAVDFVISRMDEVRDVQSEVKEALRAQQFDDRDQFYIELAVEEALVNALKHGNQLDEAKKVFVRCDITTETFQIRIEDEGPGFNPGDVPDPTAPENLERPCGRGLLLIRNFMNEVQYHGRGNVVTMAKNRSPVTD